ncbi:MAG: calcium-binding protein [Actinobacteria bacterium]|nr:MAG: calcium-binding protein [Actinomycetota bacterium]
MAREGSLRVTWKTVARRPNLLSTGSPRQEEPHMQLNRSTMGVIAALALVPSAAMAATIQGGPGNERLRGTRGPDRIDGNAGNDRIFGLAGDDVLIGGPGNDRVLGGPGNDRIFGVQGNDWLSGGPGDDTVSGDTNNAGDRTSFDTILGGQGNDTLQGGDSRDRIVGGAGNDTSDGGNGNDLMSGGPGDDVQHGGAGNDRIFANLGQDTTYGEDGDDDLWALARGDVAPGPGVDQVGDTLDGGPGNDRFHTRDGEVDRITCGDGVDIALLDQVDVITDASAQNPNGSCERVIRKAPKRNRSESQDQEDQG